ncbi:MAG: polysaccharide deacetylase family protein [Alphaproteobacteria bacterium]|nr:polysaccharide deacetylase family protein [Alphaproteobacteria bacterium]
MKACALLLAVSLAAPIAAQASDIRMAITVDDLPAHSALPVGSTRVEIAADFLAALKAAKAPPVYGFINGVQTEREPASTDVLPLWRAAGNPLGNHGWSHLNLAQIDVATFEAELKRNEPLLEDLAAGSDWRWFRFPFLSEGETPAKRTAVRALLKARGYHTASVTMSFGDYAWNEPYARCVEKGDQTAIADLEASYLKAAEQSLTYSRGLSATLYGKDIPYVLLMHLGAFDARMAPRLLALYQSLGVTLVTLHEAEKDPFYAADVNATASPAPVTLENAMTARGLAVPKPTWDLAPLDALCR